MTSEFSLTSMTEISQQDIEQTGHALRPRLAVTRGTDVTLRRVSYLWDHRIPVGAVTIMPGAEGIGKTTVGVRLMADLTNGKLEGEFLGTARNVLVISPEDGVEDVMAPRFQAADADMNRVFFAHGVERPISDKNTDHVMLPNDVDALTATVQELDIAMIWIDSLVTTLPDGIKTISYREVSAALRPLNRFAEQHRVAIVAPWHLNKGNGHESATRMMDSRAFRTATRSVLMVIPMESQDGSTEGVVALDKANAGPTQVPALRYRLQSAWYEVEEDGVRLDASCAVADWVGPEDGDGRQIIRESFAPPGHNRATPAQEWLSDYLEKNGETERRGILETAAESGESGLSESAVQRAAVALHVQRREESGQNEETGRPWRKTFWSLPERSPRHHIRQD